LINNRQGGRRRGRGGQRPQGMSGGGGGGGGGNRQDNRQRGNAAQLLEKYKSMARDAQLGGDRVQTEYYLQFADHYFRVLGETRVRFDEQRRGREDEDDGDDEGVDLAEADSGNEAEAGERPQQRRRGREREREERLPRRTERQNNGEHRDMDEDGESEERIAFEALPPAIGAEAEGETAAVEEQPRPRRRAARRPRAEDGESDVAPVA
jgi:hypothetical protein